MGYKKQLVKKAVFPVAGFGTRFLPATKAMPKELLPIVDKPLIQYAAEEAVAAGIDTLIFVTGRNKRAIEDHFDANRELELALREKGKFTQAKMVQNILPEGVECIFVRQPHQLGLGHAILCAERAVGDEPFAILLADDFLTDNKIGVTEMLVNKYVETGNPQISVVPIEGKEISNYGVIFPGEAKNVVKGLVEKPDFNDAPSNLASVGRYILPPKIFKILKGITLKDGEEMQLADAINLLAKELIIEAIEITGRRFDCGSVEGFMKAIDHEYKKRKLLIE